MAGDSSDDAAAAQAASASEPSGRLPQGGGSSAEEADSDGEVCLPDRDTVMALLAEAIMGQGEEEDGDYSEGEDDDDDDDDEEEEEEFEWEEGEESDDMEDDFGYTMLPSANRILALNKFKKIADIEPEELVADVAADVAKHCAYATAWNLPKSASAAGMSAPKRRHHLSRMLSWREAGVPRQGMSPAQRCHITNRFVPTKPCSIVEQLRGRAYIGQFTRDGSIFVAASQENQICLYDVGNNFKLRKDIVARNLRWTVTDTCLSPDQRLLIYASITPSVHVVNVGSRCDGLYSIANITDVHEEMHLDNSGSDSGFGIWSVRWSSDGRELVAGTNDHSMIIYDVQEEKASLHVHGHNNDVNAVAFLDESSNLILTGSDDELCKLWDKRCIASSRRPQGVFVGHTQGITHIDPKGDGRHFITNSKDQSIKLWDVRKMYSDADYRGLPVPTDLPRLRGWDYRWMDYPARGYDVRHPQDVSLKTYHGHSVVGTLIRCYFSPAVSTGQRFIYTGSHEGSIYIYDLLTGERVSVLEHHDHTVRDCSWHPSLPMLVSVSWDGTVVQWGVDGEAPGAARCGGELPVLNRREAAAQPGRRGFVRRGS